MLEKRLHSVSQIYYKNKLYQQNNTQQIRNKKNFNKYDFSCMTKKGYCPITGLLRHSFCQLLFSKYGSAIIVFINVRLFINFKKVSPLLEFIDKVFVKTLVFALMKTSILVGFHQNSSL